MLILDEEFYDLPLHTQLKMLADEVEKITTKANSSYAATNALRGLAEKYEKEFTNQEEWEKLSLFEKMKIADSEGLEEIRKALNP